MTDIKFESSPTPSPEFKERLNQLWEKKKERDAYIEQLEDAFNSLDAFVITAVVCGALSGRLFKLYQTIRDERKDTFKRAIDNATTRLKVRDATDPEAFKRGVDELAEKLGE